MANPISQDKIAALLKKAPQGSPLQTSKYVRWVDIELRCASRGCTSPTYVKTQGIPYCMIHTIYKLTELLDNLTLGGTRA